MEIGFVKYFRGNVTVTGAILELRGGEIISLKKKHLNFNINGHFFLENSEWRSLLIQKLFLGGGKLAKHHSKINRDHDLMVKLSLKLEGNTI